MTSTTTKLSLCRFATASICMLDVLRQRRSRNMLNKVGDDVIHLILEYLSLSGDGGAISLAGTCRAMRKLVLTHEDFDEFALTLGQGGIVHYEQRALRFLACARSHLWVRQWLAGNMQTTDFSRCRSLCASGNLNVSSLLSSLNRPELLRELILVNVSLPEEDVDKDVITNSLLTPERFPNLIKLAIHSDALCDILPSSVTDLTVQGSFSSGDVHFQSTFPRLQKLRVLRGEVNDLVEFVSTLPMTIECLEMHRFAGGDVVTAFALLAQQPRLRKLVGHFEASIVETLEEVLATLTLFPSLREVRLGYDAEENDPDIVKPVTYPQLPQVEVLEAKQTFFCDEAGTNPFVGLPAVRRLNLMIVFREQDAFDMSQGKKSMLECVFEALPQLCDLRVHLSGRRQIGWTDVFIWGSNRRPGIKVSVFDQTTPLKARGRSCRCALPSLWSYRGRDPMITTCPLRFQNLVHLGTLDADHLHLLGGQVPANLRSLTVTVRRLSIFRSRKRPELFSELDILFKSATSSALDTIEVHFEENFDDPLTIQQIQDSCADLKLNQCTIVCKSHEDWHDGVFVWLMRKPEQGRFLAARFPPGTRYHSSLPFDKWRGLMEFPDWPEQLGSFPSFLTDRR